MSWLEDSEERVLLLADWREAKPVMEELGKREGGHDVLMCVAAQSDKMFRRAVDWATKQRPDTDIMVSSSFSRQNLLDLFERHLETSAQLPPPEVPVTSLAVSGAEHPLCEPGKLLPFADSGGVHSRFEPGLQQL